MLTNIKRPRSGREQGNVTLEMAAVLPLLLLIVAGIIDLGLLFWEKEVLTNASREGARAGARAVIDGQPEQKTATAVMGIVQAYLDAYNVRNDSGTRLVLVNGANFIYRFDNATPANLWVELQNISVRMMLLPNIGSLFSGTFSSIVNLDAKTTMTAEWSTAPTPTP
ncbi:MAG: TadE/TadG family type IV pilus assembly protein [Desulfobaccales bacterium]